MYDRYRYHTQKLEALFVVLHGVRVLPLHGWVGLSQPYSAPSALTPCYPGLLKFEESVPHSERSGTTGRALVKRNSEPTQIRTGQPGIRIIEDRDSGVRVPISGHPA